MLHAQSIKDHVRELRRGGLSLNQISEKTLIPRTTICTWITDIKLTEKQSSNLRDRVLKALQIGRIKAQEINRNEKARREEELLLKGTREVKRLSQRELFLIGIALYWAEGFKNKHEHRLGFCNSDPTMIKFYIKWLEKCLQVKKNNIVLRVTLNEAYKDKINEFQTYWSETTGVPLQQFTKPFYQSAKWKRTYNSGTYHGVLRIHVKDSLDHLLKMRGWIEGLRANVLK